MLSAICWLVATGLAGRRDRSVAIAATLVAVESVVFVANRGVCPLTPLAERHGASRGGVSDIFLPVLSAGRASTAAGVGGRPGSWSGDWPCEANLGSTFRPATRQQRFRVVSRQPIQSLLPQLAADPVQAFPDLR